jgi:hypothetical protein
MSATAAFVCALSLMLAASATACIRPQKGLWTGTEEGYAAGRWEAYVNLSSETYPGSEVRNVTGRIEYTGQGLGGELKLSGAVKDGTTTCSGASTYQADLTGQYGGRPYSLLINYTSQINGPQMTGTWEEAGSWGGIGGTFFGTAYAAAQSQGSQPGEVVLVNPSSTLTTALAIDGPESTLPPGVEAPVGVVSYEVTEALPGSTIDVTRRLPAGTEPTGVDKLIGGEYLPYPAAKTKISGNEVTLEITLSGPWDESLEPGVLLDPVVPLSRHRHRHPARPTVMEVSPDSGPRAGGTPVTVSGSGFTPGVGKTICKFKKSAATNVTCPSTETCTMRSPPATSNAPTVTVKATSGGKTSKATFWDEFTYG